MYKTRHPSPTSSPHPHLGRTFSMHSNGNILLSHMHCIIAHCFLSCCTVPSYHITSFYLPSSIFTSIPSSYHILVRHRINAYYARRCHRSCLGPKYIFSLERSLCVQCAIIARTYVSSYVSLQDLPAYKSGSWMYRSVEELISDLP